MNLLTRSRGPFAPLAPCARPAPLSPSVLVAWCAAFALLLLLPAGLAGQVSDSTVARLERRIDAIQAQLDSLRSELHAPAPTAATTDTTVTTGVFTPAARTKTTQCVAHQPLPDPECTPGAIMTQDLNVICHTNTGPRRNVTAEVEREAYASYGVAYPQPRGTIELDHLISLELGGDNTVANLWPQFATPQPGFHEKDLVENELHRRVCDGEMTLDAAVRIIATDWLTFYQTTMHGGH